MKKVIIVIVMLVVGLSASPNECIKSIESSRENRKLSNMSGERDDYHMAVFHLNHSLSNIEYSIVKCDEALHEHLIKQRISMLELLNLYKKKLIIKKRHNKT